MAEKKIMIGIIGGSGIYNIDGVEDGEWIKITTPFGDPSDCIYTGVLNDIDVAFLPRHGTSIHRAGYRTVQIFTR